MIFVTTGDRIAVENFTTGLIYTVTFSDTSIVYMMCVGIGSNFVMLQGPNPSLFCLTMESASQVSTIDVHDPTPPEPPTPIENALQYQTGEPPFTFTTTESSLFSWYIEGPCGVKTANLFNYNQTTSIIDNSYINQSGTIVSDSQYYLSYPITVEADTVYTWRFNEDTHSYHNSPTVGFYDNSDNLISVANHAGAVRYFSFTTPSNCAYIRASVFKTYKNEAMLNVGSEPLNFEPYGYKISILSNENAETIYLDEALAEGERLYSVNIDTVIVTDIGENTLTVTPTPPEMQIVYGIYAED